MLNTQSKIYSKFWTNIINYISFLRLEINYWRKFPLSFLVHFIRNLLPPIANDHLHWLFLVTLYLFHHLDVSNFRKYFVVSLGGGIFMIGWWEGKPAIIFVELIQEPEGNCLKSWKEVDAGITTSKRKLKQELWRDNLEQGVRIWYSSERVMASEPIGKCYGIWIHLNEPNMQLSPINDVTFIGMDQSVIARILSIFANITTLLSGGYRLLSQNLSTTRWGHYCHGGYVSQLL